MQERGSQGESSVGRFEVSCGEGRCAAFLSVAVTDDGLIAYLYGGQKPHLGAAVMSLPRPSLADGERIGCDTFVLSRPGHKDDAVAKALAEQLCKALNCAVCVAGGIHIDAASQDELDVIRKNCRELGDMAIQTIQDLVSSDCVSA